MLYQKQIVKYKIESMYFSFMFGEEFFVQSNTKEQMIFHRYSVSRGPVPCAHVHIRGLYSGRGDAISL